MAELGNLLSLPQSEQKVNVEVEMLDYGFINECNDRHQLSAILEVLKSGKEGIYPDVCTSIHTTKYILTHELISI